MWGGVNAGLQGVFELHECERCDDPWLMEVQEEIRHGALSEDNFNFLHGLPTAVPGSYVGSKAMCENSRCQSFIARVAPPARKKPRRVGEVHNIIKQECEECKAERRSRAGTIKTCRR